MSGKPTPNRLKSWRKHRGLTQESLAARVGVAHSTIQRIENGRVHLTDERAVLLASALGCRPADLFAGDVSPTGLPVRAVPVISWVQATAWSPDVASIDPGAYDDVIYHASNRVHLIALKVNGDSMDRIASCGSMIIVDTNDLELRDKSYYIFRRAGSTTFKRWRDAPPRIEPYSTNPEHETTFVDGDVEVIGRVIEVITRLT